MTFFFLNFRIYNNYKYLIYIDIWVYSTCNDNAIAISFYDNLFKVKIQRESGDRSFREWRLSVGIQGKSGWTK